MNEEMRKEFIKQFLQYTGVNIFFDDHGFPSVDGISIITNVSVQYAWWAWQTSREAMKPIKLPDATFETPSGDSAFREDAVIEAIQQAGYKVE